MCLICVELSKNKLTPQEARRNLGEWVNVLDKEHRYEVLRNIWKKEDEAMREEERTNDDNWTGWGSD
jgi:hypothetical protein